MFDGTFEMIVIFHVSRLRFLSRRVAADLRTNSMHAKTILFASDLQNLSQNGTRNKNDNNFKTMQNFINEDELFSTGLLTWGATVALKIC